MSQRIAIAIGIIYVLFSGDYVAQGIRSNLKRVGIEVINSTTDRLMAIVS